MAACCRRTPRSGCGQNCRTDSSRTGTCSPAPVHCHQLRFSHGVTLCIRPANAGQFLALQFVRDSACFARSAGTTRCPDRERVRLRSPRHRDRDIHLRMIRRDHPPHLTPDRIATTRRPGSSVPPAQSAATADPPSARRSSGPARRTGGLAVLHTAAGWRSRTSRARCRRSRSRLPVTSLANMTAVL
jgi:hypothetical protein